MRYLTTIKTLWERAHEFDHLAAAFAPHLGQAQAPVPAVVPTPANKVLLRRKAVASRSF